MYERYVALGDSQTEGLNDGDETTGYRGWADRLAEHLAELDPSVRYANLAVRGKRTREVLDEQLAPALALRPDLATVVAGLNDLIRPSFDPAVVAADLETMFAALTDAGARVGTVIFPDLGRIAPSLRRLARRVPRLNALIVAAARRHDVAVLDGWTPSVTTDRRLWSPDRIHATPLGHQRIAHGMAHALGLPGWDASWRDDLPPQPALTRAGVVRAEAAWAREFVLPWLGRRVRRTSSGAGRVCKRPELTPVRTTSAP
ncbi:MAG: SGNH/GDSL hydrolase family protein [Jatrophihabitans sp.]|uniref:SGNH/GDSL hydrolase family protein n=1 Tax=Jatrophihabitans sp. TaxID=1932789 RepID=UPI003F7D40E6